MNVGNDSQEVEISWRAVLADTPVFSRDGQEIGHLREVLASDPQDIFHGVVVRQTTGAHDVMITADNVKTITTSRLYLDLTSDQVRAMEPYVEEESYRLGFVGLLRNRLGWVPDRRDPE